MYNFSYYDTILIMESSTRKVGKKVNVINLIINVVIFYIWAVGYTCMLVGPIVL